MHAYATRAGRLRTGLVSEFPDGLVATAAARAADYALEEMMAALRDINP